MCMLSFIPAGVFGDAEELWNGAEVNPDGHGWAMISRVDHTITVRRSMSPHEAIESLTAARRADPSGPALFHSRIATSGRTDITGVHPFFVGDDRRTVVGHNGILFSPSGDRSDTRIFAEDIAPIRFANLDRPKTFRKLEKFAGSYNKLVILSINPIRQRDAYIVNESAGHWSKTGVWHSNYDYLGYGRSASTYRAYADDYVSWEDWDDSATPPFSDVRPVPGMSPWPCDVCGSHTVDKATNFCDTCGCCNDCLDHRSECQCWIPDARAAMGEEEFAQSGLGQPIALEPTRYSDVPVYPQRTYALEKYHGGQCTEACEKCDAHVRRVVAKAVL